MKNAKEPQNGYIVKQHPKNKWAVYQRSSRKWIARLLTHQAAEACRKLVEKAYGPKTAVAERIGQYYIVWRQVKNERWLATFSTKQAADSLAKLLMSNQ